MQFLWHYKGCPWCMIILKHMEDSAKLKLISKALDSPHKGRVTFKIGLDICASFSL